MAIQAKNRVQTPPTSEIQRFCLDMFERKVSVYRLLKTVVEECRLQAEKPGKLTIKKPEQFDTYIRETVEEGLRDFYWRRKEIK